MPTMFQVLNLTSLACLFLTTRRRWGDCYIIPIWQVRKLRCRKVICPWSHNKEVEGLSVSDTKAYALTRCSMVNSPKVTQPPELEPRSLGSWAESLCIPSQLSHPLTCTEGQQDLQEVGEVRETLVFWESEINSHQYIWVPHAELGWGQRNPSRWFYTRRYKQTKSWE